MLSLNTKLQGEMHPGAARLSAPARAIIEARLLQPLKAAPLTILHAGEADVLAVVLS